MFDTKIKYFKYLSSEKKLVNINLHLTDKVYTGYIRAVNDDGVFVTTKMGDDQRIEVEDAIYIFYSAISFVECGP